MGTHNVSNNASFLIAQLSFVIKIVSTRIFFRIGDLCILISKNIGKNSRNEQSFLRTSWRKEIKRKVIIRYSSMDKFNPSSSLEINTWGRVKPLAKINTWETNINFIISQRVKNNFKTMNVSLHTSMKKKINRQIRIIVAATIHTRKFTAAVFPITMNPLN